MFPRKCLRSFNFHFTRNQSRLTRSKSFRYPTRLSTTTSLTSKHTRLLRKLIWKLRLSQRLHLSTEKLRLIHITHTNIFLIHSKITKQLIFKLTELLGCRHHRLHRLRLRLHTRSNSTLNTKIQRTTRLWLLHLLHLLFLLPKVLNYLHTFFIGN